VLEGGSHAAVEGKKRKKGEERGQQRDKEARWGGRWPERRAGVLKQACNRP